MTEINGRHIVVNRELKNYIQFHPLSDQPIELTVERDGQEITKSVTPRLVKDEEGKEVYRLGFSYNIDRTKAGVWENIKYSAYEVKFWIFTTIESLGQMFSGKVSAKEVSGPVGIVQVVGDVVSDSMPGGMVVKETSPVENLIVVASIAVIFAIRKYLFVPAFGREDNESPFAATRGLKHPADPVIPAEGIQPQDDEITAELDVEAIKAGARQG